MCLYVSLNIYVYKHRYKTTVYERWGYKFERARRNIWNGFGEERQREHDVIIISKFIIIIWNNIYNLKMNKWSIGNWEEYVVGVPGTS